MIEELTKEKEAQRSQIKELKIDLELQESKHEKKDSDFAAALSKKEKEIEELHKLLSKSYNSASSSLDKVRLASRLENETKELARKIKESSAMKSYKDARNLAGLQPINSGDRSISSEEQPNNKSSLSISQLDNTPPTSGLRKEKQ